MAFDRSKFAPTKKSALEDQQKEAADTAGLKGGNNGRVEFLKIEPGANKFRIYPAHDADSSFAEPSCKVFLPVDMPKRDAQFQIMKDSKGDVIKERRNMPIFNSKTHAGTKVDLVEEYIRLATELYERDFAPGEAAQKIKGLSHFKTGISPKLSWVFYADKITKGGVEFGRLEVSNGIKQQLNALAMTEDPEEAIDTDPFTDPDTGRPFLLQYNKGQDVKPQDVYKATLASSEKMLTDEQLEHLDKQPSLKSLYHNSFKRKDLERQIEGLYNYDQFNKIGVFQMEEWADVMDNQLALFPEEEEEDVKKYGEVKKPLENKAGKGVDFAKHTKKAAVVEEEEEEEEEEQEDETDLATCGRDTLKRINKEEGLGIVVTASKTEALLRSEIALARKAKLSKDSSFEEEEEDEDERVEERVEAKSSGSSRLANLRKKKE